MTEFSSPDETEAELGESDEASKKLKLAAIRGVQATLASRFVFEIGGFLATLVIARLITPADLGRASVALIIPMAAAILTYESFASALVQRKEVTVAHWRTSTALGLGTGTGLCVLTAALAVSVGPGLFDEETAVLLLITSPTFILAGLSASSRARMQRELMLPQLVGVETASFVIGQTVSIILVIAGLGAYGMVIGSVVGSAVETVAGFRVVRPYRPKYDRACANDIARFGVLASIAGLTYVLRRSGPYAVLAAVANPQVTGLYARAFQVSADNQSKLTGILQKVSYPVMARASSLDEIQRVRRQIVSANALVVLPLLAILSVTAKDVIPLLYGDQWVSATEAAQALVLAGAAITLTSGADAMSLARGRPGDVAVYNVVSLITLVPAIWLAAPHGIMPVAWTCVTLYILHLVFAQFYLVKRATSMPVRSLLVDAGPATVASVMIWIMGWFAYPSLASATPAIVSVGLATVAGLALYALFLRVFWPSVFRDSRRQARQILSRQR